MVELQCCVSCGVEQSESVINIHVATLLKKNKRRYFIILQDKFPRYHYFIALKAIWKFTLEIRFSGSFDNIIYNRKLVNYN